ncbi:hypothetical protein E2I00_009388 [Balaenoptera physalus]|uniref:FH2 domain-containing protein n=1 Tax=Balaenoptera physalus TaxID=9770 RepID=A0A643C6I0_BALPH|nr:hypothetical protein E2I00_009388 [Balaenoptera physalus]
MLRGGRLNARTGNILGSSTAGESAKVKSWMLPALVRLSTTNEQKRTFKEEQVRGKTNIWTLAARQQHHYQIDTKSIEELFGQQENTTISSPSGRGGPLNSSFREGREELSFHKCYTTLGSPGALARPRGWLSADLPPFPEKHPNVDTGLITILDAKRSMNIGIFLKQFKKSPLSIVEDIHQGKSEHYGSETLREFLKLLPESEEIKKLKTFSGDVAKLSLADSFLHCLIQVPNYSLRIEAMVLKKEFLPSCSSLYTDITILRTATKELMSCEELHSILHLVLQAGNIMNAGGYAGNAVGFKLSSLLKLADTKANKPGMNLLHFVAQEAQKKDAVLLNFSEKLHHVQEAARLSLDNTEAELHSLFVRTRSLKENVQRDGELCQQMEDFLQFALKKLAELERWKQELQDEAHTLIDFFCEDKDTVKLDECLQIFRDFCVKFNKAVKPSACGGKVLQQLHGIRKDNHDRESSTGSPEELKFHSLPRSCPRQAPASRARTEPGEQRDQGSSPAHRPPASEGQEEAPHPTSAWPSQLLAPGPEEPASALPRVQGNGVSILRKRNSEPVGLGPVREHELVTGLAQFDLQAAKGPEELAPLTVNDFSPMELASVGDESPQSLGASNGSPTPVGRGAQGGPILAPGDGSAAPDEPISAAPVSEGSSDPENQDPGPLFNASPQRPGGGPGGPRLPNRTQRPVNDSDEENDFPWVRGRSQGQATTDERVDDVLVLIVSCCPVDICSLVLPGL